MDNSRKRFQLSSLSQELKEQLGKYIKHLGGSYLDKQIFTNQVSHVVCGKPNRSEKYLSGCVSGRWVLRKEYIEDSYKQGKWLSEENYEWDVGCLSMGDNTELISLYSAPARWRNALKGKKGAFENWNAIVCVKDTKMKKAYERLLEAGCANIIKKKPPFLYDKLVEEITHIFVEPDMICKDVLALERDGIPCLTPDYIPEYIIQTSKEQALAKFTMNTRSGNVLVTNKQPSKSLPNKLKPKQGVLPGKENGLEMKTKPVQVVAVKGVKRKAPDCDMCLAKRQKKMDVLLPNYYSFVKRNDGEKARTKPLQFPAYVSNIVESYVDEGSFLPAIATLSSSLSKNHAPSSACLYMVINNFLLGAPTKQQATESYNLLRKTLRFYPLSSNHNLYLNAFMEQSNDKMDKNTLSQFVHKVTRMALQPITNEDKTNRTQDNANVCMQFLGILFREDACSANSQHQPMILDVLWPGFVSSGSKEFVTMCYKCLKLTADDNTKLMLWQILVDFLSLGLTALKQIDEKTERDCKESLAQQLFIVLSKNGCSKTTKLFLQGCHSSWLKMRVTELMLDNYDKRLISPKNRGFMEKNVSLMKIVSFYFFLLPKTTEKSKNNTRAERDLCSQEKSMVNNKISAKRLKRNEKGETLLHLACIHNNASKVEELLKQDIDVNTTDYAGWTALHEACNHGHYQCVEKILNYHGQTNKVGLLLSPADGTTVLHDAVINNHLPVVKLLLKSGGLTLLNAKMSNGQTPCDLAVSTEMANHLSSEMDRLKENDRDLTGTISPQVLSEQYSEILKINKNKRLFVTMEDCENYLFLVSQLLQTYISENTICTREYKIVCTNCKIDVECQETLSEHIDCLEKHLQLLTWPQELSMMCELYINTMKILL